VHYDDPQRRPQLKPEAIWEIEHGLRLSAADVYSASQTRSRWYQQMLALFERHDFLALPSAQVFPFDAEQPWPKTIAGREMDSYHRWMEVTAAVTLSGCPALSMPAGFDPRGLPMGIQLVAPPRDEHSLLRLAHAYEQQTSWVKRRPPLP